MAPIVAENAKHGSDADADEYGDEEGLSPAGGKCETSECTNNEAEHYEQSGGVVAEKPLDEIGNTLLYAPRWWFFRCGRRSNIVRLRFRPVHLSDWGAAAGAIGLSLE